MEMYEEKGFRIIALINFYSFEAMRIAYHTDDTQYEEEELLI